MEFNPLSHALANPIKRAEHRAVNKADLKVWHERLEHLSPDSIRELDKVTKMLLVLKFEISNHWRSSDGSCFTSNLRAFKI